MDIYMIGIDLAKSSFALHAVDRNGRKVWKKTVAREKLALLMANLPPCKIAMEACGSCHYWARKFREMGHEPLIISAQFVKPFVKSQKNDSNDSEAIVEAAFRPSMRFVSAKEIWQQDLQSLHRIRTRVLDARISLSNQMRGLLGEYGIIVSESVAKFRMEIPLILEDAENDLTDFFRIYLNELYEEYIILEERVKKYDRELKGIAETNESCQRLMKVPGVGVLTSTAFVCAMGDPNTFRNGREVGAWLGLVPRQHSTGGVTKLRGITKRGDKYLRQLMIHGARSYLCQVKKKINKNHYAIRAEKLWEEKGYNKAAVALANRNARIMWSLLKNKEEFLV
jgi:transposase